MRYVFPLLFSAVVVACGESSPPPATAANGGAKPPQSPLSVTIVVAEERNLPVQVEQVGTVAAISSVDLKAQVAGQIAKVHVREGQEVAAGALLFEFDARSAEAQRAQARAQVARDEAASAEAQRQLARAEDLLAKKFVAPSAVDVARTSRDTAQAALAASRAALAAAEVALSHTRIHAPGAGRAGAVNVYPGSVVQALQTPLVSLTRLDPIEVAFALPQRHLADLLAAQRRGPVAVELLGADGAVHGKGVVQFVDSLVNAQSGTVLVKARFANPARAAAAQLWPGAFVRTRLSLQALERAVVIPQAAIIQTPKGPIAYAVVDGKAVRRVLEVIAQAGAEAAVKGVAAGERIVLDGRQNLRPDAPVVEREAAGGVSDAPKPAAQS